MKLHGYQELGRDFLRNQRRAALWLDMGMGKTAVALSALEPEHLPALIVAPKRPAELTWPAERDRWRPDLGLVVAKGTPVQRRRALDAGEALTVIGQSSLADAVRGGNYRTLILDEASGYKAQSSQRWKAAKKLSLQVDHVWELTGTPSPNGFLDIWAQVYLLDAGARLGRNYSGFRDRYFRPGRQIASGQVVEWHLREQAEERIYEKLGDICLSMSADDHLDLPPVSYNVIETALPPAVARAYKELARELVVNLDLLGGDIHSAANAAVLTSKLSQITAGFVFDDEGGGHDWLHNENVEAVKEVVAGTGSPVVVFYQFRPQREALLRALPGAVPVEDLTSTAPWDRGDVPVLLAHPASAAHGLNLQYGGHTVVWATPTWNLEHWLQGNKRVARQGQTKPVMIHTVAARGSINQVTMNRLADKTVSQQELLDNLASPM